MVVPERFELDKRKMSPLSRRLKRRSRSYLAEGKTRIDDLGVDLARLGFHQAIETSGFPVIAQFRLKTLNNR